jgi:hypothetical protein
VIYSIARSKILSQAEINVLFVKANRFLDKDSLFKEKLKIKNEIKANYISTASGGIKSAKDKRTYAKNEEVK